MQTPPATREGQQAGLFVAKLEERRAALALDNRAFAAHLGISPALWSRLRSGERGVSLDFARSIIARWPEFIAYLSADLMRAVA